MTLFLSNNTLVAFLKILHGITPTSQQADIVGFLSITPCIKSDLLSYFYCKGDR
jgi:hypothetical protein